MPYPCSNVWGFRIDFLENSLSWLQRQFETFVIALGIGIGTYFALPFEPSLVLIGILALVLVGVCFFLVVKRPKFAMPIMLILLGVLGLGRAAWHSDAAQRPKLPDYERSYQVEGWIKAIEKSGPRQRWVIAVDEIQGIEPLETPDMIRVTTFDRSFGVTDYVQFRAELSSPPGPVIPGGYNPSFRAYFQKVGGYGFMVSKPQSVENAASIQTDRIAKRVTRFRYGLADRIRESAPEATAGLQVALLTGIRTWVPEQHTDALRAGGLAHILAISGLHMGLVAGSIYALVITFLVRISKLARRMDVRKIAAVVGIITACIYLMVSGASVATQRAFIMTVIVFLAIILDRQAISIRSVAVAAFITLYIHPEALISPGFQMSFAAVIALVVVYREWDKRRIYTGRKNWARRLVDNFKGLTVTSVVAGGATAGFGVLHFNRVATFGLLGNLLAMPIFTFWVMPMAIVVYLALPFGLEEGPLWLMGKGIELILFISNWVQNLPSAIKYLPSGPSWIMGVFGLAFIGLCLGRIRVKWASLAAMVVCWIFVFVQPHPDIRIGENGSVAFWQDGESPVLYVDRKNTDRYGRREFLEAMGVEAVETKNYKDSLAQCDALGCRMKFHGIKINIIADPTEIIDDCQNVDLVIMPKRKLGARAKRLCKTKVIDAGDLNKLGAHSLFIEGGSVRTRTARQRLAKRPWHNGYNDP